MLHPPCQITVLTGHHSARVTSLSVDPEEEIAVSCSLDGSVVVFSIMDRAAAPQRFELGYPVYSAAPDPRYTKGSRLVCLGGERGELVMASKGFLGTKLDVKHGGEGPIRSVCWAGQLAAWANGRGVQVFDTALQRTIQAFEFRGAASHRPSLVWEGERLLYMAWGSTIRRAATLGARNPDCMPWHAL